MMKIDIFMVCSFLIRPLSYIFFKFLKFQFTFKKFELNLIYFIICFSETKGKWEVIFS